MQATARKVLAHVHGRKGDFGVDLNSSLSTMPKTFNSLAHVRNNLE